MVTFVKCEKSEVNWLFHSFIFKKWDSYPLFPKSQPFETILTKENEVTPDSPKKKWSGQRNLGEFHWKGLSSIIKGHRSQVKAFFKNPTGRNHLSSRRKPSQRFLDDTCSGWHAHTSLTLTHVYGEEAGNCPHCFQAHT